MCINKINAILMAIEIPYISNEASKINIFMLPKCHTINNVM